MVGVDGSETADLALNRAALLAAQLDVELHVVAVVTDTVVAPGDGDYVLAIDHAEQVIADAVSRFGEQRIVQSAVPGVKAADALCRYAERHKVQLIVIGNRNMRGVRRLLGSVPNDVAHNAPCDVLIVKTT